MNWSILASVMDTPFPHNLKIPGSNPLHIYNLCRIRSIKRLLKNLGKLLIKSDVIYSLSLYETYYNTVYGHSDRFLLSHPL